MTMTRGILQEVAEETESEGFIFFSLFAPFAPVQSSEPEA
jgi:hypothetical protein